MVEKEKPSTSWHKIVETRTCKAGDFFLLALYPTLTKSNWTRGMFRAYSFQANHEKYAHKLNTNVAQTWRT